MAAPAAPPASALAELAPLLRRALALDPAGVVRLRIAPGEASALIRLPFGVLVGRRIPGDFQASHDATYPVGELLEWIDGGVSARPRRCRCRRRATTPGAAPGRRTRAGVGSRPCPTTVVRDLVRRGALTLKEAAEREGLPGAQPRAEVADALLDSTVLTRHDTDTDRPTVRQRRRVEVSLRLLSALVRMGFLARDSHLAVDIAGALAAPRRVLRLGLRRARRARA